LNINLIGNELTSLSGLESISALTNLKSLNINLGYNEIISFSGLESITAL